MSRKDIIRWVIDRMMAHEDCITQELALRVEREARQEWGGQSISYVAKTVREPGRPGRPAKLAPEAQAQAIDRMLSTDVPMEDLAGEFGASRRTMYRLLKRGPGRS